MQLESVILQAEAYDVALDITFGKSELALILLQGKSWRL